MKKKKVLSGCIRGRQLARVFTWDDARTESALLYCPHGVHLVIAAALIGTQGQVSGGDTQNVLWLHLRDGGVGEGEGGFTA